MSINIESLRENLDNLVWVDPIKDNPILTDSEIEALESYYFKGYQMGEYGMKYPDPDDLTGWRKFFFKGGWKDGHEQYLFECECENEGR